MTTIARAEFRAFGHGIIDIVRARMWNGRTVLQQTRTMPLETYVLSRASSAANVKIRSGVLDIKIRVGDTPEGFQVFQPTAKWPFPLTPAQLADLEPYLGVTIWSRSDELLTAEEFISRAAAHRDLRIVQVEKERFGFTLDDTICEYARVYFNGALLESACVESDQYDRIAAVVDALGLGEFRNTNYIEAASRIVGLCRPA